VPKYETKCMLHGDSFAKQPLSGELWLQLFRNAQANSSVPVIWIAMAASAPCNKGIQYTDRHYSTLHQLTNLKHQTPFGYANSTLSKSTNSTPFMEAGALLTWSCTGPHPEPHGSHRQSTSKTIPLKFTLILSSYVWQNLPNIFFAPGLTTKTLLVSHPWDNNALTDPRLCNKRLNINPTRSVRCLFNDDASTADVKRRKRREVEKDMRPTSTSNVSKQWP
jgi:hypothetical protein